MIVSGKKYDELFLNYQISETELRLTNDMLNKAIREIYSLRSKIFDYKREVRNLHKKIKELKNEKNS